MFDPEPFAHAGGLFATLALAHFVADWVFQLHEDAMTKHIDGWSRATHCLLYTLPITGMIYIVFGLQHPAFTFASFLYIFIMHYLVDSYFPVYLWAKYVRRVPQFREPFLKRFAPMSEADAKKYESGDYFTMEDGGLMRVVAVQVDGIVLEQDRHCIMWDWMASHQGFVYALMIDQIFHLVALWPVVALIMLAR